MQIFDKVAETAYLSRQKACDASDWSWNTEQVVPAKGVMLCADISPLRAIKVESKAALGTEASEGRVEWEATVSAKCAPASLFCCTWY